MGITISEIIHELELMNPDDKCGILDPKTRHIYEIKKVAYNPDVTAFILVPDTSNRLLAASIKAKTRKHKEQPNGQRS